MIVFMDTAATVLLLVMGLVMGSFAGAQVWRLRARQLQSDKKTGEPYDKQEYDQLKSLMGRKQSQDRSQCLSCGQVLRAVDLVPLFSWASSGGRCRYCGHRIGLFEPIMEIVTAVLFASSYWLWPFGFATPSAVVLFVLWLLIVVVLVMLAAYDIKWQLLPDVLNFGFMALALVFVAIRFIMDPSLNILSVLGAVGMLAGVYGFIYIISRGAWIGLGDVKLGVGLGLLLGDWSLAFFALFLANLIGCIIVIPAVVTRKLGGGSRIAFGPLLVVGTMIAFWWGSSMLEWFFKQTLFLA